MQSRLLGCYSYFLIDMQNNLFFELIQVALGRRERLSRNPSPKQWAMLYQWAEKQTILGVCFRAVKEMAGEVPQAVYMKWLAVAASMQQQNEVMNQRCAAVYEAITERGFHCAVLKGQGVAELYDAEAGRGLSMLRQSGDIDVWLWKEGLSLKENRRAVVEFARTIEPDATGAEHHVGVEWMGTEVELHYEPAYFCNPFANRRFRKWFMGYDKSLFTLSRHGFGVPEAEFNRVFLLAHAFRHYLSEGLGLRQVMDYYFARKGFGKEARTDGLIKDLRMQRFEMAMNWVADFVFENVEKEEGKEFGQMLLEHIMQGGNFGKYKERSVASRNTHLGRFVNQLYHDLQLARSYPSEAIWAPLSMIREFVRIRI